VTAFFIAKFSRLRPDGTAPFWINKEPAANSPKIGFPRTLDVLTEGAASGGTVRSDRIAPHFVIAGFSPGQPIFLKEKLGRPHPSHRQGGTGDGGRKSDLALSLQLRFMFEHCALDVRASYSGLMGSAPE
jgi:hypothetical protein